VEAGTTALPRTTITKVLWKYIKDRDLQNPNDRREIIPDDLMGEAFGSRPFSMFQMAKLLNKRKLVPGGSAKSNAKSMKDASDAESESELDESETAESESGESESGESMDESASAQSSKSGQPEQVMQELGNVQVVKVEDFKAANVKDEEMDN